LGLAVDTFQHNREIDTSDARFYMRDAATSMRNRGHTKEHALRLLADLFGLKVRRAVALVRGCDSIRLSDEELRRFKLRYEAHLAEEIEHLSARSAEAHERYSRFMAGER
jgi:hypothetical protein